MAASIQSTRGSVVTLNLPRAVPALISYAENIVRHRRTENVSWSNLAQPKAERQKRTPDAKFSSDVRFCVDGVVASNRR